MMIATKQIVADRDRIVKRAGRDEKNNDEQQRKDNRSVMPINRCIDRIHFVTSNCLEKVRDYGIRQASIVVPWPHDTPVQQGKSNSNKRKRSERQLYVQELPDCADRKRKPDKNPETFDFDVE